MQLIFLSKTLLNNTVFKKNYFITTVLDILSEGEGLEGFDLPPRYPLKSGNIFKRVCFPGSLLQGTKTEYWYIESKESASDLWAINRAAAAKLKRSGVPQAEITQKMHRIVRTFNPTVKTVTSQDIPDNERNIVTLKA